MRIVVVGGGKVGYHLARTLIGHDHEVFVIEENRNRCGEVANRLDIPVFCGDGTAPEILGNETFGEVHAVLAVTGLDEVNLVCCELAKKLFPGCKTVARVNDPKNTSVMFKLGVDIPVSSTDTISRLLEREIDSSRVKKLYTISHGDASINQLIIPIDFRKTQTPLSQMNLPAEAIVVGVTRQRNFFIPSGATCLQAGDEVLIICHDTVVHDVCQIFGLDQ